MAIKRTKIDEVYEQDFWNDDSQASSPEDIFSFTEIRSCADIYRMFQSGVLDLQPDFQRDVVWKKPDRTRFIDSIIKGFPIPSLCFSYDSKKQKWLVIDGLQRISTIIAFLDKDENEETYSDLDDVETRIAGRTAKEIRQDERCKDIVTRIENCSLPLMVLRCDYSKKDHLAFLFTVFHRLNSTGVKLNNQEIRNCIYAGSFNKMLRDLDSFDDWVRLIKKKRNENDRMRSQELILRFFAFHFCLNSYEGKLTSFLNTYMDNNKNISQDFIDVYSALFKQTISCLYSLISESYIDKSRLSLVVLDSILYGISKNLQAFLEIRKQEQAYRINRALLLEVFSEENLSGGIMKKNKLMSRMIAVEEALR